MNWRSISLLGVVALTACDIKIPFLNKEQAADTAAAPAATASRPDTLPPADTLTPAATEPTPQQEARREAARREGPRLPAADEPFTPAQTGTVDPGMSRDQVVGVWGAPVAERTSGTWTYLYFRNGCEVSCGTFDVVFLENGAVVDAIVRHAGHVYSGTSSSPPGRQGVATPPRSDSGGTD
ncbi:MAG TPA: hypothetical protein VFH97_08515 [Gemmatimonadales bacterium]|nr:hypothetical protein [Gemmatimonadales bacterium]